MFFQQLFANICKISWFWCRLSTYISMTSLFAHKVAQPTKWRFLPKNLSLLVILVIELAFTWSWVNKNHQNLVFFQSQFSMAKVSFIILIFVSVKIIRLGEQLIINHFLITSFFKVVQFLKLGPIFVASWSSEHKFNHKNN